MRPALVSFKLSSAFAVLLFVCLTGCAQTASIRGRVTDQNGAIVVGAKVTIHGPSGLVNTTTTDSGGSYSFANLPPGNFIVEASAPSLILQEPAKMSLRAGSQM